MRRAAAEKLIGKSSFEPGVPILLTVGRCT